MPHSPQVGTSSHRSTTVTQPVRQDGEEGEPLPREEDEVDHQHGAIQHGGTQII
jgi:hypothetical protein